MKFKFSTFFSTFAISLATLAFGDVHAKNAHAKNAKLIAKDPVIKSFFSAADNAPQTFTGPESPTSPLPSFAPLTFTKHVYHRGHAIESHKDKFRLKKGVYLISFAGTFTGSITDSAEIFDIALQLGSDVIFINTDSADFINPAMSSFTKTIRVEDGQKDLSIVVRTQTPLSTVTASTRSITIEQLK